MRAPAATVIARLAGKLDTLALCDSALRVFGAEAHGYRRKPVSGHELSHLETILGQTLPDDYRQWMLRIGAGAGPSYGLWAPADAARRIGETRAGSGGLVRDPSDIAADHFEAMARRLCDGVEPGDACITTDSIRGVVPINDQGCGGYTYLLLAGAYAGRMLDECSDCIGEPWTAAAAFRPAGAPDTTEPPTFLAWLEDWLDRSLAVVSEGG